MRLDRAGTTGKLDPGAVETTEKRAPGPGPIRKVEWQPLGKKYLEGRNIMQLQDTARGGQARQCRPLQKEGEGEREVEVADAQLCQGDDPHSGQEQDAKDKGLCPNSRSRLEVHQGPTQSQPKHRSWLRAHSRPDPGGSIPILDEE